MKMQKSDFIRVLVKPFGQWGWNFNEAQAEMLYPMLEHFSLQALESAVKVLLRECKFKPKPVEIIHACEKFSNKTAPSGVYEKQLADKQKLIQQEVHKYADDFFARNQIATRAATEGWLEDLRRFVYSTASTMAYIKHNQGKYYGWNGAILPRDFQHNYSVLIKQSIPNIRATGSFDVMDAMPSMLPNYWKEKAV